MSTKFTVQSRYMVHSERKIERILKNAYDLWCPAYNKDNAYNSHEFRKSDFLWSLIPCTSDPVVDDGSANSPY